MAIADPELTARASDWFAETLRLTLFPAPGTSPNPESWWRAATGRDPETRTTKPATREYLDEGAFQANRLRLTVNALGVIQWQMLSRTLEALAEFPNVGRLHEAAPLLREVAERWLPISPPATRIAFGATVLLPVTGRREGYESLARFLRDSVRIDPDGSSDLLYRINRPRQSATVASLAINRLSTWTVLRMGVMAAPTGSGEGQIVHEAYACRAEVDINTVPTFRGTFDAATAAAVFQELQQLGVEILERGDIP